MTSRNYIAMADSLGLKLREINWIEDNRERGARKAGFWAAVDALSGPLKADNSRFKLETFVEHILAVADGSKGVTT